MAVEVRGLEVRDEVHLHGLLEQEQLVAARALVLLLSFVDAEIKKHQHLQGRVQKKMAG